MTKAQIYTAIAAVLTTLQEAGPGPHPRSHIHLALQHQGYTSQDCYALEQLMRESGLITVTASTIENTAAGNTVAAKLNATLTAARN